MVCLFQVYRHWQLQQVIEAVTDQSRQIPRVIVVNQ